LGWVGSELLAGFVGSAGRTGVFGAVGGAEESVGTLGFEVGADFRCFGRFALRELPGVEPSPEAVELSGGVAWCANSMIVPRAVTRASLSMCFSKQLNRLGNRQAVGRASFYTNSSRIGSQPCGDSRNDSPAGPVIS
jgi:hypothetical protein